MRGSLGISVLVGLTTFLLALLVLAALSVALENPMTAFVALVLGLAAFGSSFVVELLTNDR